MQIISNFPVRTVVFASTLALAGSPLASAQWTATVLSSSYSEGLGGGGNQQVGYAYLGGGPHAALWNGSAASIVDLHPTGFVSSTCNSTDGSVQGGSVSTATEVYACIWSGSAGSFVNLHPTGYEWSAISSVSGNSRVGRVSVNGTGNSHAALWTGSSNSFTDLHPAGSTLSSAFGCSANQQVGTAFFGGVQHGGLWSGSAGSWIDLTPSGANAALAYATDGVQQVGRAEFGGVRHGALWTGSAASFVDLSPAGASWTEVFAVDAGEQVGFVSMPFQSPRAVFWSGTAASMVDLHAALPAGFSGSRATGIWHANGHTYVVGTAVGGPTSFATVLWRKLALTTYCTAKTNSLGCTPTIAGIGNSSATATSGFIVRALSLRNQSNGLLLYGNTGRAANPFHGGTMCVGVPRLRAIAMNSDGNNLPTVDCSGYFLLDMNTYRTGSLGGSPGSFLSVPGTIVDCQYWARDAGFAAPNNVQLSNALEFEIGF